MHRDLNVAACRRLSGPSYILQQRGLRADHCLMVGDRSYDVAGAIANGIPVVGVSWGYGTQAELAGAQAIIDEPAALLELI